MLMPQKWISLVEWLHILADEELLLLVTELQSSLLLLSPSWHQPITPVSGLACNCSTAMRHLRDAMRTRPTGQTSRLELSSSVASSLDYPIVHMPAIPRLATKLRRSSSSHLRTCVFDTLCGNSRYVPLPAFAHAVVVAVAGCRGLKMNQRHIPAPPKATPAAVRNATRARGFDGSCRCPCPPALPVVFENICHRALALIGRRGCDGGGVAG